MVSTTPVEALRREGDFPSIATLIKRDAVMAWEKSLRLNPANPRYQLAIRDVRHRTARGSWRKLANDEIRQTVLAGEPRALLPPPTSAPWRWGSLAWTVNLDLMGGSRRTDPDGMRLVDAMATICSYGPLNLTIFTDGSAVGGTDDGGYAAVVFRGTLASLELIAAESRRGARLTSSFDAEVSALKLAVEWLIAHGTPGRSMICSDSRAALATLQSGAVGSSSEVNQLRSLLREVPGVVHFQWVPGHCGLNGNEFADRAASAARTLPGPRAPITYSAAKAYIRRTICDPPLRRRLFIDIYGDRRPPFPCPSVGAVNRRRQYTLLAQLRGSHSCILAEYRHFIGIIPSPICPKCEEAPQSLEHWLQTCPATMAQRALLFGRVDPPLSVLTTDAGTVALYLRQLRLL